MSRLPGSEVQAVLRACSLLRAFRYEGEVLALPELVERTALSKTTVFRLMASIIAGGLAERAGKGRYRCLAQLAPTRSVRLGFAAQTDSEFSRNVTASLQAAAARRQVQLLTVNNRYSAQQAVQNADYLIAERVDLVLEFQTYERVAPVIAAKFLDAKIPVIAVEIPHPGATYFGANNYQAGLLAGRALGRWAKDNWNSNFDEIVLLDLPIAGSLLELRGSGVVAGLDEQVRGADSVPVTRLDAKGSFDRVLNAMRKFLRQGKLRRRLVGAVNDVAALAALTAFEEAGAHDYCAVVGQNGIRQARAELRRRGTRLIGTVAYFPERYGDDLVPLALTILQGKPIPPAVFARHQLLTAKNVNLVYAHDIKGPSAEFHHAEWEEDGKLWLARGGS
ncbi:MAG: substrate-binding domain-containing protein [Bryobacterales bacterium]|nr:substrate-binding domain-containing protein [Bryobacterales bacterium]